MMSEGGAGRIAVQNTLGKHRNFFSLDTPMPCLLGTWNRNKGGFLESKPLILVKELALYFICSNVW